MNGQSPKILVSKIGGHQVTMTNRRAGTMLVSEQAYHACRRILIRREIVQKTDNQSHVLSELGASIDECVWLRDPDRNGNLLLLDREAKIMFVVTAQERILVRAYDTTQRKRKSAALPLAA